MKNNTVEEMVEEFNLKFGGVQYPFVEGEGAKQQDCIEWLRITLTQHHQDQLREVYREILDKAPGFSINGGEKQLDLPTLEYVARIEALAQTRGIDISDKTETKWKNTIVENAEDL